MIKRTMIEEWQELNKQAWLLLKIFFAPVWKLLRPVHEWLNRHMLLESAIVIAACIVFLPSYIALWRGTSEPVDWLIALVVALLAGAVVYWMRKAGKL